MTLFLMMALTACGSHAPDGGSEKPLPPSATFEGLPLSGNRATAVAAGFSDCVDGTQGLRCRREGLYLLGVGPLNAAIDLDRPGPDGGPRFDHVTLWHPSDQGKLLDLKPALEHRGWASCLTADAERYWHPPSPVRIAIDTSYWGSRRAVISAPPPDPMPYC